MYTIAEVAGKFKVHPRTVKRWIDAGKLPATKLPGGHYRISDAAVRALQKAS